MSLPSRKNTDQMGREISVPVSPLRIVSLVPSQTELLFYLGLEEEVVGITKFCIHPAEQFKLKSKIGGTKNVRIEAIHALIPDLIIGNKEENEKSQIEELSKHYPVWMSDIKTLEDALEMIERVGALVNKKAEATTLVDTIFAQHQSLKKQHETIPKLKAAYFIWRNPWMVCAADTYVNEMLRVAGFENIFLDQKRYPIISEEELKKRAPQVILLSSEPFPFKEKHLEELQDICPNAKILLVDGEAFSWYGSRLLSAFPYFEKLRSMSLGI